jgi:hypothetical protein
MLRIVGQAGKLWLGALLLAVLLLLSGCSFTPFAVQSLRASPIGEADLGSNTIGVYLYPEGDILSPAADIMHAAGARWTRSWFSWHSIEPELTDPPTYHWAGTDARLLSVRQAGLEPIFLLGGNANWASDTFCGPIYPEHQADFQRFLRDLVGRYSAPPYNIHLWEIYNEPDSAFGPQGHCFGARGAEYATSLRLAYEAIEETDPTALVLFGGVSYDFFVDEGGRFDSAFLDDALTAGAGPYFDILAFHYYPAFEDRWNAFGPGVAGKAAYLRSELARYGLDKPLALTEIGRPTRGPEGDPTSYSEIDTARFAAPALTLARTAGIAPIIWFTAVDKPNEPYDYGLLRADLTPESSLRAYRAVLPALQGGAYAGEVGVQGKGRAYRFRHGGQDAIVAWAEDGAATLSLAVTEAWVVDRRGYAKLVCNGATDDVDAKSDGALTLSLSIDPIIIWLDHAQEGAGD